VVLHLEAGPDPTFAVSSVGVVGMKALTEGLRVGQLVREVQQRPEDGGRLRVRTPGTDTDVAGTQGADAIEESRGVPPQDPTVPEGLEENHCRLEGPLAAEDGPRGPPSGVKIVRVVRVHPREFGHTTIRDINVA